MPEFPSLPSDFTFGVASASYQVEGAVTEDGRGRSVWDTFCERPGAIANGESGAVACDHYHRYREDVALLTGLGVNAYRFSVSWPRVRSGDLDFYDRLVDELCAADIAPVPTLFHWDLPLALQEEGGWLNRDTASRFAEYASVVAERLGDRVKKWITLNEPAEQTLLGHALGAHAPGKQLLFDALPVAHHQLLAHGLAVRALRAAGVTDIGVANSHGPTWPASEEQADVEAAEFYDVLLNRLFADPLLLGAYPDGIGELMPGDVESDLKVIAEPLDWYGINFYAPTRVGAPQGSEIEFGGLTLPAELPFSVREIDGYPVTDFGWPVVPAALTELLTGFRDRYGDRLPPVVITENGCSYEGLDDQDRIAYLDGHVRALHRALEAGVDVRGYFVWSLLDNFEWAEGYARRFGLVQVNFETQERTPKASYGWMRDMLRAQG